MHKIVRSTTPTNRFRLPESLRDKTFELVRVTYRQWGHVPVIVEREFTDFTPVDGVIEVTLTQEETLRFRDSADIDVQLKIKTPDGAVMASKIKRVDVGKILSEELM